MKNTGKMRIKTFEDHEYDVQFVKIPERLDAEGVCYPPDEKNSSIIKVDPCLKTRRQINVLIEEVFHAYFFDLPEWKAKRFAGNLGKVIYKKYLSKPR